jgi:hypothetical protein
LAWLRGVYDDHEPLWPVLDSDAGQRQKGMKQDASELRIDLLFIRPPGLTAEPKHRDSFVFGT